MIAYYLSMNQKGKYQLTGYRQTSKLIEHNYFYQDEMIIYKFYLPVKLYPEYCDEKRLLFYQALKQHTTERTIYLQLKALENRPGKFKKCAYRLAQRLELGFSFSQALMLEGYKFPLAEIQLFSQAEKIGALDRALKQQIEFLDHKTKIKKEFKENLRYPVILLVTTLLMVVYIFFYIFPKLQTLTPYIVMSQGRLRNCFVFLTCIGLFISCGFIYCYKRKRAFIQRILRRNFKLYALFLSVHILNILTLGSAHIQNHYDLFGFVALMSHKESVREDFKLIQSLWQQGHSIEIITDILEGIHPELIWLLQQAINVDTYQEKQKLLSNELNRQLKKFCNLLQPVLILSISSLILFVLIKVIRPMMAYYDSLI